MKKYYYSDGVEKFGPFTLDELKNADIQSDTLMWSEGMEDWKPAGQMPQIALLFDLSSGPPPVLHESERMEYLDDDMDDFDDRPMPKNYMTEAILVTIFCCLPFGIAAIVNAAKVETMYRAEGYRAARDASQKALKWVKWSLWVTVAGVALYLLLILVMVLVGGL